MNASVTDRTMTAAAVRVLALVALLAVRAHCALSNGLHDGYSYGGSGTSTGGGVRLAKLDKFLHDRLGEPPALSTDRASSFLSRTTAASVVVRPEDEDEEDDSDVDEDGADDDDRDGANGQENANENYDREPARLQRPIRLRHSSRRKQEFDQYDQYVQHEEPVRTMSSISDSKWKNLGNRKAVDNAFRDFSKKGTVHVLPQGDKGSIEASEHLKRVLKDATCKVPRPRVVKVIDHYPSSNKNYMPSCTVLHLCADDTGCCDNAMSKCAPKSSEPILLHFIVYTRPKLGDPQSSYQTLRFYNHTECGCLSDDSMPKDEPIMPTPMEAVIPPVVHRIDNDCKCPTEYTVRYLANGSCSCDCFDKQHECIRYKKGNIYFNFLDKYCISSGQCLMPKCEYGLYSHRTGRCPKKFETLYSFKNKHYF